MEETPEVSDSFLLIEATDRAYSFHQLAERAAALLGLAAAATYSLPLATSPEEASAVVAKTSLETQALLALAVRELASTARLARAAGRCDSVARVLARSATLLTYAAVHGTIGPAMSVVMIAERQPEGGTAEATAKAGVETDAEAAAAALGPPPGWGQAEEAQRAALLPRRARCAASAFRCVASTATVCAELALDAASAASAHASSLAESAPAAKIYMVGLLNLHEVAAAILRVAISAKLGAVARLACLSAPEVAGLQDACLAALEIAVYYSAVFRHITPSAEARTRAAENEAADRASAALTRIWRLSAAWQRGDPLARPGGLRSEALAAGEALLAAALLIPSEAINAWPGPDAPLVPAVAARRLILPKKRVCFPLRIRRRLAADRLAAGGRGRRPPGLGSRPRLGSRQPRQAVGHAAARHARANPRPEPDPAQHQRLPGEAGAH